MSFHASKVAWNTKVNDGYEKLILVYLADRANSNGLCWPPVSLIARESGVCLNTVRNVVQRLETAGHLKRIQRLEEGEYSNNLYQLAPAFREAETGGAATDQVVQQKYRGGASSKRAVVHQDHCYKDKQPNSTSKEPSNSADVDFEVEWQAFRKVPGFRPQYMPKYAALKARREVADELPASPQVVEAINRYAMLLEAEQSRGKAFMVSPARWYSERRWQDCSAAIDITVLQRDLSGLGNALDRLRNCGLSDPEIASWFDRAIFQAGPPATFRFENRLAFRTVPERYGNKIRAEFGADTEFKTKEESW